MERGIKSIVFALVVLAAFCGGVFAQKPQTMTVNVYFLNEKRDPNMEDCKKVYATPRQIPQTKAVAAAALEELFKGVTPEEAAKGFISFTPAETKGIFKNVNIYRGSAYLNFTKLVYEQMGNATSSCGGGFFTSVEKTLTQFPTIKKVYYAIEGNPLDFYDWVQVGECPKGLKNCDSSHFK
jgi:spore germination protein GerM